MSASTFNDDWLAGPQGYAPLDADLGFSARISRSRVSSVSGLGYSDRFEGSTIHSLEGVLRAVEQLKVPRCPFDQVEEIGKLAHGETFVVTKCRYNSHLVAVKHVRLEESASDADRHRFQRRVQSVLREISITHHPPLAHHPNIMSLIGYGWRLEERRPAPYVVVELATEGSLRAYLKTRTLTTQMKMILAGDVACGLMALHQCGIVHGDLKLDNVIVFLSLDRPSGSLAKVCDFGHSLVQSSGDVKHQRYYGTPLYNAPEVAQQNAEPIWKEDLHKCDIWAYGLLVWEILANGAVFFQKDWLNNPQFAQATEASFHNLNSTGSIARSGSLPSPNESPIQPHEEDIIGNFDVSRLPELAKTYVNGHRDIQSHQKAHLRPVFNLTLQEKPRARLSNLNRLFIVGHWNKAKGTAPLQSRLAIYTGTSSFQYSIFSRDHGPSILWGHQKQMLQDFEYVSTQSQIRDATNPAALQTALCFLNGFGTSEDRDLAVRHLLRAKKAGHLIANLLEPRLIGPIARSTAGSLRAYTTDLSDGFRFRTGTSTKLTLLFSRKALEPEAEHPLLTQNEAFPDYASLKREILERNLAFDSLLRVVVTADGSTVQLNLLELAIVYGDADYVRNLSDRNVFSLDEPAAWGDTPLIQATRQGTIAIVRHLLNAGADPMATSVDQCTVFHWLFCLDATVDEILDLFQSRVAPATKVLDRQCSTKRSLHPQWPFQIRGTPLAIAIAAAHDTLVDALLKLGADATAPALPEESDGKASRWSAFHLAVRNHMSEVVHSFLQSFKSRLDLSLNPSLDQDFPIGCALSYATVAERYAFHGTRHLDALRTTIAILPKAAIYQVSALGVSPFLQAIDVEDYDVVCALLDRYPELARLRMVDPAHSADYIFPIHFAAQIGCRRETQEGLRIVEAIHACDPQSIYRVDSALRTALHVAVTGISSEIAQFLISKKANIEATDVDDRTPLHYCRFASTARTLIENGADIDHPDNEGSTAAHFAAKRALEGLLQELINQGATLSLSANATGTPLHCAVQRKSRPVVIKLLEAEAPIDACDSSNRTPLLIAMNNGRTDLARLLLDYGANPLAEDSDGVSPLRMALSYDSPLLLRRMFQHDSIKGWAERELPRMLYLASSESHPDVLREILDFYFKSKLPKVTGVVDDAQYFRLLSSTADTVIGLKGRTPLHNAAISIRADNVDILLEYGAKANQKDKEGNTALLLACWPEPKNSKPHGRSRVSTCKSLLDSNADILAYNNNSANALVLAQITGDFPLMTFLLESVMTRGLEKPSANPFTPTPMLTELVSRAPFYLPLLFDALRAQEWEFLIVCIKYDIITTNHVQSLFPSIGADHLKVLQHFIRGGDYAMARWVFQNKPFTPWSLDASGLEGRRVLAQEWSVAMGLKTRARTSSDPLISAIVSEDLSHRQMLSVPALAVLRGTPQRKMRLNLMSRSSY